MASNTSNGAPRLSITIDAITSGLKKGLEDARKELKNFNDEVKRGGNSGFKNALEAEKLALAQSRTEAQQARTAIAQLALAKKQDIQVTNAGSGSIVEMRKRLSELRGIYDRLSESARNSTRVQSNLVPEIKRINDAVSKAEQATGRFQRNVGNYGSALGNATGVTMEFNRIIQDAPFGMMGIGNNIQQLAANWQTYTASAKQAAAASGQVLTTGGLLRGVLSSMISPANLLTLGIAAVTSGWVLYEKWQQKANKSTKETEESLRSYIDTLKGVARAQADGQANALKELTTVDQLYKATQNLSLPMSERLRYAKELVKTGGELFSSTSAEVIVAGEASSAYDKLTVSIQQTAMAQAFMQKMTDNATKALNNNLQILNEANEIQKLNQQIQRTQATLTTTAAGGVVGASSAAEYKTIARLEQQRSDRVKNITDLNKQNSEVLKEQDMLQKGINNSLEKGGKLVKDDIENGTRKVKDNTKEIASLTNGILRDGLNYYDAKLFDINQKYSEIYSKITDPRLLGLARINEEAEKTRVTIEKWSDSLDKFSKNSRNISLTGTITTPSALPGLSRAQERLNRPITSNLTDEFSKQFTSTLRRGLASTFNDLFSNISNLSEGAYEIEKKYADLRANATAEQIAGLNKMEALERKINNGLTNMLTKMGNTFTSIAGNMLSSALSTGISSGDFSDLTEMFKGNKKGVGYGAAASLLGGALGSVFKPSDTVGQSLSGVLAGAGTGAALGSIIPGLGTALGAALGGVVGGLSSLFGASKRKREEELMELQLAEQRKLVALSERQNALAYSSSIIGQQINGGMVTAVDRDAFGNLVAKINGKDIELVLERTKSGRG